MTWKRTEVRPRYAEEIKQEVLQLKTKHNDTVLAKPSYSAATQVPILLFQQGKNHKKTRILLSKVWPYPQVASSRRPADGD